MSCVVSLQQSGAAALRSQAYPSKPVQRDRDRFRRARRPTSSAARSRAGCRRRSASRSSSRTAPVRAATSAPTRWRRRRADGYTLLVGTNGAFAINKVAVQGRCRYDPEQGSRADLAARLGAADAGRQCRELKLKNFRAFIELRTRATPGKLSYASVGGGSASHLTMELLKSEAKRRARARSLPGLPARGDRYAGRQHPRDVRDHSRRPAAREGREDGGARRHGAQAQRAGAGRAERGRAGLPQLESLAWIGLRAPAGLRRGCSRADDAARPRAACACRRCASSSAGRVSTWSRARRRNFRAGFARIGEMGARHPRKRRDGRLTLVTNR